MPPSLPLFDSLAALGTYLRQQRETRQLTLTEAAHDTRIRTTYLDAIERGDLAGLPELVFVRGFVKRYGDYLNLDGDALSLQVTQWVRPSTPIPVVASPPPTKQPLPPLRPLHLWAVYVGVVILSVGGLSSLLEGTRFPVGAWIGWIQSLRFPSLSPQVTAPTPASPHLFDSPEAWTYIAGVFPERVPASIPRSAPTPSKPVQLDLRVVERASWVRIVADNRTVLEQILQPGTEMSWSANDSIVVRAGNAGGILLTFNNQDLGVMGNFGEVKEQTFQRASEQ